MLNVRPVGVTDPALTLTERQRSPTSEPHMFYVCAIEPSGNKVLVSARCPNHAESKVVQRLNTRVVSVEALETIFFSDLRGLAYLLEAPPID